MEYDLNGLRLFVLTAEHQNLSRAAEAHHLSLAAASARIKSLEQQAGLPLLYRKARGMHLTPAGEAFLLYAREVLRLTEKLRRTLDEHDRGLRGHVRIYANTTVVNDFFPEILPTFLANNRRVDVELHEKASSEIARAVLDARADIGIVAGEVDPMGLKCVHFSTDRLVVIVPRGHALEKQGEMAFGDILDEPAVAMQRSSTLQIFLSNICESLGKTQKLRVQVSDFYTMCRMVSAGVGVAVIPESAVERYLGKMPLTKLDLTDKWSVRERYILLPDRERLPEHTRMLVELLCDYHRKQ